MHRVALAALTLLAVLVGPPDARSDPAAQDAAGARAAELREYTALFISLAQQALAHPRLASPMPCLPHWLAGNDHVVVAVSEAGRQAGLVPGDRLQRIGGVVLTGRQNGVWDAAMRALKANGSTYDVQVVRGTAPMALALPCAPDLARQLTDAERAMWTAVAQRDWTACVARGGDMIRVFGGDFSPPLMIMGRCASARTGDPDAALTSRLGHALLEELIAHPAPSPDLREQLFLTLRDLEAIGAGSGGDYAAMLRTRMIESGVAPPR